MKIIHIDQKGLNLIKHFEGFRSEPYLCPAKVPTIGYGTTYYPNGKKVTLDDKSISEEFASQLLEIELHAYERAVDSYTTDEVNQQQFDALVSFVYNLGVNSLKISHLLQFINHDPSDPKIKDQFMLWTHAGGKVLPGLVTRREAEANLYFS